MDGEFIRTVSKPDIISAESNFCEIYFSAISELLDISNRENVAHLKRYFTLLRSKANANCEFFEDEDGNDDNLLSLFMDSLFYRITYIYRNCTLFSSAVHFQFQNLLEGNPNILENILSKKVIRICSLGGGPASDVVGLIQALEDASKEKNVECKFLVSIIDIDNNWKNTCFTILKHLKQFRNSTWKIKFIQTDLSKFYTEDAHKAIREADVLTMVKFSSEFIRGFLSLKETIREISQLIQPGSILFFLDRHKYEIMKSCGGYSGTFKDFQLVYEEVCDLHTLSNELVEKNFHLYDAHFGKNVCNTCLKIFVRAWVKTNKAPSTTCDFSTKKRYQAHEEKYDAMQFLGPESFQEWKNQFSKVMEIAGWTERGLKTYVAENREMRDDFYKELVEKFKVLELAREEIIRECKQREGHISEDSWIRYSNSKRDVAFTKRQIYCEQVINLRGHLRGKFLGVWKE